MSTITLYASKINQMPSLINDAKKAVKEYKSDLKSLNLKVLTIDNSICNVDDVISSIKSSTQTQGDKIDALDKLKKDVNEFVSEVVRIDGDAADAINKSKDDFYDKYEYLKPECEKSGWEKFKDGCKKVGEWCKEHWKAIVTVVIVITAVVILVTCPACGAIIAGACWGAISGAVIGGVAGGLSSLAAGGSFWAGFEEGAFSGALTGAIFGGIGGAGSLLGNVSNSCKLFSVMKWTSRITGVLSGGMGLFDTAAMVVGLFDPQNAFVQFNQKLHSSKLYNGFQFTVSALAVFSGSTYSSMKKHQETLTCFVAGTMILTASGLVAIENIKAGDKVISTDPETFETAEKTVLETYIREDSKLIHLMINGEEIITTETHPFYVKNRGFVNAGELAIGDELLDSNCNVLLVENHSVELTDEPVTVYNFQVEDFHTYHVGKCRLLVHNANCNQEKPVLPKYDGKTTEGVMVTPDGKQISFKSGNSSTPSYPQYKAQSASHVEGKAALYMRENGINEATVFHNNPNGTCGFCDRQVPALLPKGAKLTVVPPSNSVANNVRAIPVPKTYIGNSTVPKIK